MVLFYGFIYKMPTWSNDNIGLYVIDSNILWFILLLFLCRHATGTTSFFKSVDITVTWHLPIKWSLELIIFRNQRKAMFSSSIFLFCFDMYRFFGRSENVNTTSKVFYDILQYFLYYVMCTRKKNYGALSIWKSGTPCISATGTLPPNTLYRLIKYERIQAACGLNDGSEAVCPIILSRYDNRQSELVTQGLVTRY